MRELYSVTGHIMQIGYDLRRQTEIIVGNVEDCRPENPPHLLKVSGPLATYLQHRALTDVEERYIESVYYFDSSCELQMIEIPQTERTEGWVDPLPVKIVGVTRSENYYRKLILFGPRRWIDTPDPSPMSVDEYRRFREWFTGPDRF